MVGRRSLAVAVAMIISAQNVSAQQSGSTIEEVDAKTLDGVIVQGAYIGEEQSSVKIDAPVKDIPFSISNYTEDFLDEIDANRVGDVYKYMTGINRSAKGGFSISIRGFETVASDRNGIMVDGLPGVAGRYGSPPTAGVERVEVFRGPASVLYGSSSPGGFVNLITKKPQESREGSVALRGTTYAGGGVSFGDENGYDATIDFTGPIDDGGRFLYRAIAQFYDIDSYRQHSSERALYVSPSLTWVVSDKTRMTLMFERHDEDASYDDWLVAPFLDVRQTAPITTRYQDPDDHGLETTNTLSYSLEHEFSENSKFNFRYRNVDYNQDTTYKTNNALRANQLVLQRSDRHIVNERTFQFFDGNLNLNFSTGGLDHQFLLGIAGGLESSDFDRRHFYNPPARPNPLSLDVDVYNPIVGVPVNIPTTPGSHRHSEVEVGAIYVSDLVKIAEHWKAMLGLRYDWESVETFDRRSTAPTKRKKVDQISPMTGIVYQPNDDWSFYASYTTSFRPPSTTAVDINGVNSFDPETGNQFEVGAKADFLEGRVNATLSVYKLTREGGLVAGPVSGPHGQYQIQVGSARSEGVELEMTVRPVDNWIVTAGYAYSDARVLNDPNPLLANARLPQSVRNGAHVWSRYDIVDGPLYGLGFGAGFVYVDERAATLPRASDGRVLSLPSYTSLDLAAYYVRGNYDYSLKITNARDGFYFIGGPSAVDVIPGSPRQLSFTIKRNF